MWNYAKLSKLAHSVGGPEKLVEKLIESGASKGRFQMIPVILAAFVIGISVVPIINYFKEKRAQSKAELEKAKVELIQGIKNYDAAHPQNDD